MLSNIDLKGMRIAVTGGTSDLGSALVRNLAASRGRDQIAAKGSQAGQNAVFVGAGKLGVSDDIRDQDRSNLADSHHGTSRVVRSTTTTRRSRARIEPFGVRASDDCSWCLLPVAPTPPVFSARSGADREGQQRVDLTRSPRFRGMTGARRQGARRRWPTAFLQESTQTEWPRNSAHWLDDSLVKAENSRRSPKRSEQKRL